MDVEVQAVAGGDPPSAHLRSTVDVDTASDSGKRLESELAGVETTESRKSPATKDRSDSDEALGAKKQIGSNGKYRLTETNETDEDEESKEKVSLLRLFKYATPLEVVLMFVGIIMAAAHGTAVAAVMIVFGNSVQSLVDATTLGPGGGGNLTNVTNATTNVTNVTTNVTNGTGDALFDKLQDELKDQAIIYAGMAGGVWFVSYLQVFCWYSVGESIIRRIRRKFFTAILHKDIGWFDTHKTGELASRLSDDILKVYDGIGDKNSVFCQWIACSIAGFVIGFVYSWRLSLVVLATTPLLGASSAFVSKLVISFGTKEQDAYAKAGAVAEEVLSSIRTVVAFGGETKEADRYIHELEGARKVGVKKGFVFGVGFGSAYFLMFGAFGLAFWYGSVLIWDGTITTGAMLTSFFSIITASFAIGSASPGIRASSNARGAAVAIYNTIDEEPIINSASDTGDKLENVEGDISFEGVRFRYPARQDVTVLTGLSVNIKKGTTVALVGPSGCGKSTCIQLLQRFYDPESGRVTLDGRDIRTLNIKWLRSQIGIVSQEPILFQDTIANNIAFGSLKDVTRDDVIAAAKMANAHSFIMNFPDGYETQVGERGAQMSGGQKQRIAIARALIRNPKILLLDEATSALDTESERTVQAALDAARAGRTTIVIAHRLSTIQNADCIVAVEDGKVAEMGTHRELMEKEDGLYHALVTMQAAVAEAEKGNTEEAEEMLRALSKTASSPVKSGAVRQSSAKDKAYRQLSKQLSERQQSVTESTQTGKDDAEEKEEEEEEVYPEVSTFRLFGYNKPEFPWMALGSVCAMANGVLFPLFGVVFSKILNIFRFVGNPNKEDEYKEQAGLWSGIFAVLGLSSLIVIILQYLTFAISGEALTKRMRSMLFRAMLRKNIGFFDEKKHSTGALATQLSADAALIQGATGAKLASGNQFIATLVAALVISFIASWQLTLVLLGVLPLVVAGAAIQYQALAGFSAANRPEQITSGKLAIEYVDNIRTVASLGLEDRAVARYMDVLEPLHIAAKRNRHIIGLAFGFGEATFFFVYAITFSFGGYLIKEHGESFEDVFQVFGAMLFASFSLGEASGLAPDLKKAASAASRILHLIDTVPEIDSESTEGSQPDTVAGNIELTNIRFRYPTRPDVEVLQDTTITANHGQTIALVGQSGCGKSTSVSLLERFYDPEAGNVNLDGQDIRTLNLKWLRQQMGLVQQEPILFDTSIADNIAYGALGDGPVSMETIQEMAKKANIHDFITTLPKGYDTNVGAKGTQLSGGQKQRVAIARALIRNPKILLLDEATSALDTESERVVQEALDVARQGRTSIVIAHRLSTIQNADKIIVLGGGQVLEQGTHSELMAKEGAYYKLNAAQEDNEGATLA